MALVLRAGEPIERGRAFPAAPCPQRLAPA